MKFFNPKRFLFLLFLIGILLAELFGFLIAQKNDLLYKIRADLTGDYVITATAGDNGTILPGTVILSNGSNQLFTVTAKAGYQIQDVLVDGTSIGAQAYYTFSNITQDHTITASFIANETPIISAYGGTNAKSKGVNYLPYLFIGNRNYELSMGCPTSANRDAWVSFIKSLNIKLANFYLCFVMGDFTPKGGNPQDLRDTISYFKENGIAVMMHTYSDLIDYNAVLAQDTRNIRHNSDGSLMSIMGDIFQRQLHLQ
jgi:hypothetical protein